MAARTTKKSGAALERLRADLKAGSPANVYIFYGEETYLRDRYLEELRQLLAPFPKAELKVTTCCPPSLTSEALCAVQELKSALLSAGEEGRISVFPATCEAGLFTCSTGIPSVILGPGSIRQAHQTNEFVKISELFSAAKAYLLFFSSRMLSADGKDVL